MQKRQLAFGAGTTDGNANAKQACHRVAPKMKDDPAVDTNDLLRDIDTFHLQDRPHHMD